MSCASDRATPTIAEIINPLKHLPGALLPILHAVQDQLGYIDDTAVPIIADTLNLSKAEVHGVISFYHHFRNSPPALHIVQLCRAESCQAVGGRELERAAKEQLGIDFHESTADGIFALEPVYCLGNCACSPALRIDNSIFGNMNSEKLSQLIAELKALGGTQ